MIPAAAIPSASKWEKTWMKPSVSAAFLIVSAAWNADDKNFSIDFCSELKGNTLAKNNSCRFKADVRPCSQKVGL